MPNHAANRLVLTGPADEIARFIKECIRLRADDEIGDALSLDLDAIVPMPPEISATLGEKSDEVSAIALAATGFPDWYKWCCAHWGTKWNTYDFQGQAIGSEIYDCDFTTAWSCPIPALRALAAAYPLLRGAVAASEPDNDWSLFGIIRHGDFVDAATAFDEQMQLLVDGRYLPEPVARASVMALLAMSDAPLLSSGSKAANEVWLRALRAIEHLGSLMNANLSGRITFERVLIPLCNLLDDGLPEDVIDSHLARSPKYERDFAFLLADDRSRTAIDRQLLKTLAACLRGDAIWGRSDSTGCADEIETEVLDLFDEEELRDWTGLAISQPGAMLNLGDHEDLRAGFFAYAERLRIDMLAHLRGMADVGQQPAVT